jgi:secreted trypsin-like serine protease
LFQQIVIVIVAAHVLRFAKISGGSDTTIENYPWQVALLKVTADANNSTEGEIETDGDDNEQAPLEHYGNGAIIASNAILTSAHCVRLYQENELLPEDIFVRVGSADRNNGGVLYTVERTLVHPDYNDTTFENDLAILFLTDRIPFTASARNVTWANSEIGDEEKVKLTSWENQVEDGEDVSEVLQAVKLFTVNQDVCVEEYQSTTELNVTENMLCAGNDGFNGFTEVIANFISMKIYKLLFLNKLNDNNRNG